MEKTSCRKCGGKLEVTQECNICSQANQFSCSKCGYEPDEQIHFQCMATSIDHALLNA